MIIKAIFSFLTLLFAFNLAGQTRTITGKVIDDDFYPIYQAKIFNTDTLLLATTDTAGNFKIEIASETKSLIIVFVLMDWKSIKLTDDCNNLDIILLYSGTYDFMSAAKVDKLRKKYFDKLPALYKSAFDKGIFKIDRPCYEDKFVPIKKQLNEIHRRRTQMPST